MRRLAGIVVTTITVFGTLVPLSATAATKPRDRAHDRHDCRQTGAKGSYVCDKGPFVGKTFDSRKGLVDALRQAPGPSAAPASVPASVRKPAKVKAATR